MLKIAKSSLKNHLYQFGYVHHFDVWVPHNGTTFLTIFPLVILYLKVTETFLFFFLKHSIFKTNCDGQ